MKFIVNKLDWNIEYMEGENITLSGEDGFYLGITEYMEQSIYIRTGMSEQMTRQTVIHELVHCFLFSYAIRTPFYEEEQVCNFLGAYLDDIMELTNKFMKKGVKE